MHGGGGFETSLESANNTTTYKPDADDSEDKDFKDHLIFLSHYKVEAGTEATLMKQALRTTQ